jgi:hypothetical protein
MKHLTLHRIASSHRFIASLHRIASSHRFIASLHRFIASSAQLCFSPPPGFAAPMCCLVLCAVLALA